MMETAIHSLFDSIKISEKGITSRTLHENNLSKTILFLFDTGQELSDHTSPRAAQLQFLKGKAKLKLGEELVEAKEGTWVYMPPQLTHAIHALAPTWMLLTLFKTPVVPNL